jgi:hypothetical protein
MISRFDLGLTFYEMQITTTTTITTNLSPYLSLSLLHTNCLFFPFKSKCCPAYVKNWGIRKGTKEKYKLHNGILKSPYFTKIAI